MKRKIITILFALLFYCFGFSQNNKIGNYIIVTYERSYNKAIHKSQSYHWIINADSLQEVSAQLSPIYFTGYSKTLLDKCLENKIVYPFDTFKNDKYDFTKDYLKTQEGIENIVNEHKVKILTVRKKWIDGLKERIRVFVTPIKGEICNCPIDKESSKNINYYGNIYLPIKNINYNQSYNVDELDIFSLQNKMRLANVSNVSWQ